MVGARMKIMCEEQLVDPPNEYLYELVGECVYLYVSRGRHGPGIDGRTNDDRGIDVVPITPVNVQ